jgi:hypothetical protein
MRAPRADRSWLTEGPRGRRLLWELASDVLGRPFAPGPDDVRAALSGPLAASGWSQDEVMRAFADSVSWARYWQEPDDTDLALADLGGVLAPAAELVEVPTWWQGTVALDEQVLVVWEGPVPEVAGAAARLDAWYDDALAD